MLTGSPIVQLVMYVHDLSVSTDFYHGRIGLRLTERSYDHVRLDAGGIELRLEPAADHGVRLFGRRDDSSDVVFLVEDLEQKRKALESRGVEFVRRRTYEVGQVTDFYDPNGHRLMLYEPSPTSLTWPSAPKIREVWRRWGRGSDDVIGPASAPSSDASRAAGLADNPVVYIFMFENAQVRALDFYEGALGLDLLERVHCCNQDCAEEIEGIAKYDGASILLSTHHMHERTMVKDDLGREYSPREFDPAHGQSIAPVFEVRRIEDIVHALAGRGVPFTDGVQSRPDGLTARFVDPFGHPFLLLEPIGARSATRPADLTAAR
jgi:catechol 2,3-dioxygenase-like lactoylglutathione lyase family enzyme